MGIRQPFPSSLVLAAVLVGLLTLSGCAGGQEPATAVSAPSGSAPATASSPAPAPTSSPQNPVQRIYDACDFAEPFEASAVKPYNPHGPAYAGSGPHLAVLLKQISDDMGPGLPHEWTPIGDNSQLVICEYPDTSYEGQVVGTCFYAGGYPPGRGGESDVESARYIYRVFEATTGKLVTTFTLEGTTSQDETCPDSASYPASVYFQRVKSEDLVDRLRPLVEGSR